jgi:hypothetical protein
MKYLKELQRSPGFRGFSATRALNPLKFDGPLARRFSCLTAALPLRVVVSPMDTPYGREG